jgi:hypothetical protein
VAWLPRIARSSLREGTLSVRTAADSLLVAVNEKDEKLWSYHADQVGLAGTGARFLTFAY